MYRVTKNQSKATQNLALLLRYISGRNEIFKKNKNYLQQNPKRACLSKTWPGIIGWFLCIAMYMFMGRYHSSVAVAIRMSTPWNIFLLIIITTEYILFQTMIGNTISRIAEILKTVDTPCRSSILQHSPRVIRVIQMRPQIRENGKKKGIRNKPRPKWKGDKCHIFPTRDVCRISRIFLFRIIGKRKTCQTDLSVQAVPPQILHKRQHSIELEFWNFIFRYVAYKSKFLYLDDLDIDSRL